MEALYDPQRHEPLRDIAWNEAQARDRVAEICRDAEAAFDHRTLWPIHPGDAFPEMAPDGIMRGLSTTVRPASSTRSGSSPAPASTARPSTPSACVRACTRRRSSPDEAGAGASLLVGSSGILLVAHELEPSAANADALAAAIAGNVEHPSNELLLGAPGTMIAARAMYARTGQERFRELWRASARTLLGRQEADSLWTRDLYGSTVRYIGTGHGFAGNVLALSGAPEWLDEIPGRLRGPCRCVHAGAGADRRRPGQLVTRRIGRHVHRAAARAVVPRRARHGDIARLPRSRR